MGEAPAPDGAARRSRARRGIAQATVPAAAWAARLLVATLRLRQDESRIASLLQSRAPMILAMWHSRILVLPVLYGRRVGMCALVSPSADGDLVADYLGRLGVRTVRGSSSRSGASGLRALARVLAEGSSAIVVPDGPRGPREVLKPGVVALARRTRVPIVPVAVGAAREWRLGTWDVFRIPKPFSRCLVRAGAPIHVGSRPVEAPLSPAGPQGRLDGIAGWPHAGCAPDLTGGDSGDAELTSACQCVEAAMRALTSEVD